MTVARIATSLEVPRSTVARVLKQRGLSRLKTLDAQEPPRRYTRRHPGELLHLDVKKLGRINGFYGHRITGNRSRRRRGAGWDFVHVAIDDASRLACAEMLVNEHGDTSAAFLARAVAWFWRKDIRVREVMTDNGSGYVSACFGRPARGCASSTCAPGPTGRAPTVSRAFHSDPAARVAICPALSNLRPAGSSA